MQINGTLQGNARTYLTHMFGRGLDDERYVVERFTSTADGEIRPFTGNRRSRDGRKRPRKVMSLRSVQRLRPERPAAPSPPTPTGRISACLIGTQTTTAPASGAVTEG